jgi:Copper transport outer membrane protein, MctB
MFDLRYHVASLAAVFIALIIGILVGVGISDRGLVDKANRGLLEQRVQDLETQLQNASQQSATLKTEQQAARTLINETYPVLIRNRLRGKHIAVVFIGSVDRSVRSAVSGALTDAGAQQLRLRALKVPIDPAQLDAKLASQPEAEGYVGNAHLESLGKELGQELAKGGDTPLWNTLTDALVEERSGGNKQAADGVIVVRTAQPQRGGTSRFLQGLYSGLAASGVPAVGVERTDSPHPAITIYREAGLSTVDDVDKPTGRLALVFLLAGAPPGQYGQKPSARDGALPPLETPTTAGG